MSWRAPRSKHAKTVAEAASAKEHHATLDADLAKAHEERARDRTTARERIAELEREAEEASTASQQRQSELDAARENEEKLARQLETALARATEAESQALAISLSHASLEGRLRTLRDEITEAFARVGTPAPAATATAATPSRMPPAARGAEALDAAPAGLRAHGPEVRRLNEGADVVVLDRGRGVRCSATLRSHDEDRSVGVVHDLRRRRPEDAIDEAIVV